MWPDQADAPFDLGVAATGQRIEQGRFEELDRFVLPVDLLDLAAVLDRRRTGCRRQQLICLLDLWVELVDQLHPGRDQLRSVLSQVAVPHVEGVGHTAVPAVPRPGGGLEQRGPLPQHFVVIGTDRRDPRPPGGRELVEVAPPLGGIPAHQREIFRREHHRTKHAEHLARRPDRGAVQPRLVGAPRKHLEVDGEFAAVVHHDGRDDRALGARA